MAEVKFEISAGRQGMNKDVHPSDLNEQQYTHQLNGNVQNEDGNGIPKLQDEHSNILCSRFKPGFKVIGTKLDLNADRQYFWLVNPETNVSEIGYISSLANMVSVEDVPADCGCDVKNILAAPLEDTVQTESCTYITVLEDSCNNCLNFSIDHPIRNVELKDEQCGKRLYWTDGLNPMRFLDLSNLDRYGFVGEEVCDSDTTVEVCVACDKLRVFPLYESPCLFPEVIQLGGNLKMGTYEFLIAYADKQGNEITGYTSITNPISIFDRNNNILTQPELDSRTNQGIRLRVSNLDNKFGYYKIAVIQRTSVDGAESYFEEGIHPITDNEVVYYTEQDKTRTSLNKLLVPKTTYLTAEGVTQSNNFLFWYGLTAEKEFNLQPVANLLGSFLRWKTVQSSEDLYQDGIATSLYKGYMRDEVYPFSIQFRTRDGYETALFPLIGRPPTATDLEVIANTDKDSLDSFAENCQSIEREQRWQLYNTATNLGLCDSGGGGTTTVVQDTNAICRSEDIANSGPGTLDIVCTEVFTDLKTYINENQTEICDPGSDKFDAFICNFLTDDYSAEQCPDPTALFGDNCDTGSIIELGSSVELASVTNEDATINGKLLDDYVKTSVPIICNEFKPGSDDGFTIDVPFEADFMSYNERAYERNPLLTNADCNYAIEVLDTTFASGGLTSYHLNYFGDLVSAANLQLPQDSGCDTNGFTTKLHKGALWYKLDFNGRDRLVLEMTKATDCAATDDIPIGRLVRITTYPDCTDPAYIECHQVDYDQGLLVELDRSNYASDLIFLAIDAPIQNKEVFDLVGGFPVSQGFVDIVSPPCGCFNIVKRDIECESVTVTYDDLLLDKLQVFQAPCENQVITNSSCAPTSFEQGKFGYVESTEDYPDNRELFDSSVLIVNESDLPLAYRTEFEENFSDSVVDGQYTLKDETDFRCKSIRHFKMPDFCVSPFMSDQMLVGSSDSIIYPLGVTIDEELVNSFLDIAVTNNLITQEKRDSIVSYEIFRGDRTLHKSIIGKGLAFDTYKYTEAVLNDAEIYYPNYPYNDLGVDDLNFEDSGRTTNIDHPFTGVGNNRFTFHSPDLSFSKPTLPTEMKLEAYQYGSSFGNFSEVRGHPGYVVLGSDAYATATALAIAEVVFESLIKIGELTVAGAANSYFGIWAGFTNGTLQNFAGTAVSAATIAAAVGAFASAVFKIGELRYQWLRTFRDLGRPENFAYYYTSEGNYNYALCNDDEGNMIRGLALKKYLRPGKFEYTEESTGKRIKVNNIDRESSVFLSFGDNFNIDYPAAYLGFDDSRTFWGQNGSGIACSSDKVSPSITKNIASPYMSLKNYVPNQYGGLQGIKWLSTSYCGDLRFPKECPAIFGGDVFISRFSLKRKIPLFLGNAMGLADLTPFNYFTQRNIGYPNFYIDYEAPVDTSVIGQIFPDIASDYNFDCLTGSSGFYVRPPSKFYLYYYGIPQFLVESEINLNNRYSGKELYENFYPNVGDFVEWTQEQNVSIRRDNDYNYNNTYSRNVTRTAYRLLPDTFEQETYDCLYDAPNGVINSLQDNSEQDLYDPWLIYKPLDFYQFPTSLGKLKNLTDIESAQVLGRFENGFLLFNAIDVLRERTDANTAELGTGGIFATRPLEFKKTDLGYAGTQHFDLVSCEYGHFWPDMKRGQVFQVDQNGKNLKEITTGLRSWFKEQLPFKILRSGIDGITEQDIDNNYKGLGIAMGWDSKFKRVFLTKKDYRPVNSSDSISFCDGAFFDANLDVYETQITDMEAQGYTFDGIEDCQLKFSKPAIPNATDVYAFFDTSSMQQADGVDAAAALNSWFADHQANNPDYTGSLYIIPYGNEDWVDYPNRLITGAITPTVSGLWPSISALPPNLNTGSWIPATDLVVLAFVDETNANYHASSVAAGFNTPTQPTGNYTTHFNNFVTNYNTNFTFFRGVIYPIVQSLTGVQGALVLQALAAIEGSLLTAPEIAATGTTVDVSLLLSENPYIPLGALKDYDWKGVYDKTSPASAVFNSGTFAQELDELLLDGESEEIVFQTLNEIEPTDSTYFEDCSFTLAYSPLLESWISYYSFKPDYYIPYFNYFQTGVNYSADSTEIGLWSHLLTNRSYRVFYGKKYDWVVEVPVKEGFVNKQLHTVKYWMDSRRYHNEYDFAENRLIGFDKATIYNHSNNSGELNLITEKKNDLSQKLRYPIQNVGSTDILATENDKQWSFNAFYNRVKNENNNVPIWNFDCNALDKTINLSSLDYKQTWLDRMRGDWFLIRLTKSDNTNYKSIFKWLLTKNLDYNA